MRRSRSLGSLASTSATTGSKHKVASRLDEIDPRAIGSIRSASTRNGTDVVARIGRYGPYVEIGEERASIPEDLAPDELTVEKSHRAGPRTKTSETRSSGPTPNPG